MSNPQSGGLETEVKESLLWTLLKTATLDFLRKNIATNLFPDLRIKNKNKTRSLGMWTLEKRRTQGRVDT